MVETGLFVFFLFCFGAAIGSFLHVVGERYGTGISFSKGRSFCPQCKKTLSVVETIPIISYTLRGAKCLGCKIEIPAHYAMTELLTGLLAVVLLLHGNILLFLAACVLIILIRIDSRLMLLPDTYIYVLIGVSIAYALQMNADFTDIVFGMLAGAGSLYLLWIGTLGKGIGFGDVKLMIPLGILFGFRGTVALLFFSFFAGGILSIFLLANHRVTPKTAIPFGPFLAGAALLLMVFPGLIDRFFMFLGV